MLLKERMISRRKFLSLGLLALPAAAGFDAKWIEPSLLNVRKLDLSSAGQSRARFIHFSDLHYKGDAEFAAEVARKINELRPDFVCFTGDLVEDRAFATEALSFVRQS